MGLLDSILGNMTRPDAAPQSQASSASPVIKALLLLLAAKAYQHYTSRPQGGEMPADPSLGGPGDEGGLTGQGGGGLGDLLGSVLGGGAAGGAGGRGGGGLGDILGGALGGGAAGGAGGRGGGGLGDILGSALGGGSAGGSSGGLPGGLGGLLGGLVAGGGLGAIVDQFRQNGYGDQVDSWVSRGQNQGLAPNDIARALGPDAVDELQSRTGLSRDEILSELSQELPDAVDSFTPDGRLPTESEASSRWV
jgi:uncharacterized protein YidB (DUF937 family)